MNKLFFSLGLMAAIALPSFAKAAPTAEVLNIGISAEFENMNPMIGQQAATSYMLYMAWRPLITLNPDGSKWMPLLIKELPTMENKLAKKKGEGIEATIELRDDAQWGDETPVTCKDIHFAWTVGLNKNVSVGDRELFEGIKSITWDNAKPKKCTIVFAKARYNFNLNMPDPLPSHIEGPVYEKFKDQAEGYDRNSLYTKDPANPGLYNGPYLISEIKLGSHVIFKVNPKFKGKKPYFQKIIVKLIPNNGVLTANLQSGNIDMISSAGGLGPDQAIAFEKKVKDEKLPYDVKFVDGFIYAHIDLNFANPMLQDVKVRRALAHSFNRQELISSLMSGKGKVANSNVADNDPWYSKKSKIYKYDRKEANKLLDEAGWKMGPKGYREKDGKTLSFTLMCAAGAKINEMIQTYLQAQFKAVGIQLFLKSEPARVFFGTTLIHRNYDMALYSWVSTPESSPRSTLHSASIPSEKNSWSGQNSGGWVNPKVDKLIDDLEAELNPKKRAEIGKQINELYAEDVPVLPVYFRQNNSVTPKGLKGFVLIGHKMYETLNVEDWSM